jgi:hypothetical protein
MSDMDWPHDPDGDDGSEGMRKFGLAVFAKKLNEDAFPLDLDEFIDEVGDHPIRIDHERVVPGQEILENVEVTEVESMVEFHRVVGKAMRENGYWTIELSSA